VTPAQFTPRNDLPFVQTTRAHGLALYVAFESAFACVSDSPDTYAASPQGLDFITALPTTWDETRFLGGDVGQYVAIARRKGTRWYVGVLNTAQARRVTLPLGQLGKGLRMTLWRDGKGPGDVVKEEKVVSGPVTIDLAGSGGAALMLEP
jgi:alpha-glucosidase